MRTYYTQVGVPLGIAPGWWNYRIRNHKPVLPACLRLVLQSLCGFFPPSGTQLDLSDWAFPFRGGGVLRYSVPKWLTFPKLNVGSGFHCLRSFSFLFFLPTYLGLDISSNLSRALSCLRLSGHNFLVQRMHHNRNRRPYDLRICDICDWHSVQNEEHILLDCPHETSC